MNKEPYKEIMIISSEHNAKLRFYVFYLANLNIYGEV